MSFSNLRAANSNLGSAGFSSLVASRLTFGPRLNDPLPVPSDPRAWFAAQLTAPTADDLSVSSRLALVQLPMTSTDTSGNSTTVNLPLRYLNSSPEALWALQAADTTANRALTQRPANEVVAANWIRGTFSPWQVREVMVDFWHNHFSVDAYQGSQTEAMWPAYDQVLRLNSLGNFRTMLGQVAQSAAMMYYLNQAESVAADPNENFAREVMEIHTLGVQRYLGEVAPAGSEPTGYSDADVTAAARVMTGWTIADGTRKAADGSKPNNGDFIFSPTNHDSGAKSLFGQSYPAGVGQAEGERFLDYLAAHSGTAQTIATKLYVHFVQDVPPTGSSLINAMVQNFMANAGSPTQIASVLTILFNSNEFAASGGLKVKNPFPYLVSLLRISGAEINPSSTLEWGLSSLGAPLFQWATPNGMPDIAGAWTGTNDMLRRWALMTTVTAQSSGILIDGPTTLFAQINVGVASASAVVDQLTPVMFPTGLSAASQQALYAYAVTSEALGSKGALTTAASLLKGVHAIVGAMAATPEFLTR